MSNWFAKHESSILMALFAVALIWLGISFFLRGEVHYEFTFNVTGVENATNATTLVSLQFECIESCNKHFSDSYQRMELCYEQCGKLGQVVPKIDCPVCNSCGINWSGINWTNKYNITFVNYSEVQGCPECWQVAVI